MTTKELLDERFPEDYFQHSNCECYNETGELYCWQKNRKDVEDFAKELEASIRKEVYAEVIKEYGNFSDGCGCCADTTVEKELLSKGIILK